MSVIEYRVLTPRTRGKREFLWLIRSNMASTDHIIRYGDPIIYYPAFIPG